MMSRFSVVLATLLIGAAAVAADTGPFANPVKDCHPCRFSPGRGQPEFDLTFVFTGSGDQKTLTALDIAPAGGGKSQRLATGDVAVSDFADGFTLDATDLNGDGLGDLALVTGEFAAGNSSAKYWIYEPAMHDFVPLDRTGAGDADSDNRALVVAPDHMLVAHVHDTNATWEEYWYRIAGHRAVAVRKEEQSAVKELMVHITTDLTVKPPRVMKQVTLGYSGDSPARRDFYQRLDAQSRQAAAFYKQHDAKKAAETMQSVIGTLALPFVVDSYPVQGTDPQDRKIVGQFNDYGFYLAEAGRAKDAIGVLSDVIDVEADRIVAYLNLADAQFASGDRAGAKTNYAEYQKRMTEAGKAAKMPPRVAERLH